MTRRRGGVILSSMPAGAVIGEEVTVATLDFASPPVPDQACALIPATCASQPN